MIIKQIYLYSIKSVSFLLCRIQFKYKQAVWLALINFTINAWLIFNEGRDDVDCIGITCRRNDRAFDCYLRLLTKANYIWLI